MTNDSNLQMVVEGILQGKPADVQSRSRHIMDGMYSEVCRQVQESVTSKMSAQIKPGTPELLVAVATGKAKTVREAYAMGDAKDPAIDEMLKTGINEAVEPFFETLKKKLKEKKTAPTKKALKK